ncbi:MAG TPA: TlpA family protein disulfide reductase [Caldithrix abyssi]|uniref:TlpA family protein disulfide reductase n=1 Tax=Caldithrix abyssi TaxID=187145 RepID=A0A7V1PVD9_CALAY|nr:TlpA family protein disulfide reductase [Caldithrix abyssi]
MRQTYLILLLVFILYGCGDVEKEEKKYEIISGVSKLPEIVSYDLEGKREIITHQPGEILVLNVWNIHCGPCIIEMPGLNKLVEKYRENDRVRFIALTNYSTDREKLKDFLQEHRFDFKQRLIKKKYKRQLDIEVVPTTIVCNGEGIISYYIQGGGLTTYKYIDRIINTLLSGETLTF